MASWAPELPDPNAGDDLAYTEAWKNRIPDVTDCPVCGDSSDDDRHHDWDCPWSPADNLGPV